MTSPGPDERRKPASLSIRLTAGALVWIGLALVVGGGLLAHAFRQTVEREFGHRLDAMLGGVIGALEADNDGRLAVVRPLGDPRFDAIYSGWYWQAKTPSGRLLRSRSLWDQDIAMRSEGTGLPTGYIVGPRGEDLMTAERDVEIPGVEGRIHLLVAGDLGEVLEGIRRFDLLLVLALGVLGAGLAVAVVIQVRFGLRPLRRLAADLEAVRDGARPRLGGGYPGEVAPLVKAMNDVLDADAELIERARSHVGNLAHALKTPLTVLTAEANGVADAEVVRVQAAAMRRLIEHHLARASAVAGAGRALGIKIPLGETARAIAEVLGKVLAERNVRFDIAIPDGLAFRGHREDLEEILGNLMENAGKWAARRIRVGARRDGDKVAISVEDDGPGLTPEQTSDAARRGWRLDEATPGWGIGLSIVADLVVVNGGTLDLGRSEGMGGLAATVRLPGA